jgi:hypothetical protein
VRKEDVFISSVEVAKTGHLGMAKCSVEQRSERIKRHSQPARMAGFFTFEIFESEIWNGLDTVICVL